MTNRDSSPTEAPLALAPGWHLYGPPAALGQPQVSELIRVAWGWNPQRQTYEVTRAPLEPGRAYWIYLKRAGTLGAK